MTDNVEHVFVYGTLLRDGPNHDRFCLHALRIEPATTTGELYLLPPGYPGLVDRGASLVHGEAMAFADLADRLDALDRLEGYRPQTPADSLYVRQVRPITLVRTRCVVLAHCYVWHRPLPRGSQRLASGRWRRRAAGSDGWLPRS